MNRRDFFKIAGLIIPASAGMGKKPTEQTGTKIIEDDRCEILYDIMKAEENEVRTSAMSDLVDKLRSLSGTLPYYYSYAKDWKMLPISSSLYIIKEGGAGRFGGGTRITFVDSRNGESYEHLIPHEGGIGKSIVNYNPPIL